MFSNKFHCEVNQYCEQLVNQCFQIIFSLLAPIPAISISLTQAVMAVVAFSPTRRCGVLFKRTNCNYMKGIIVVIYVQ